MKRLLLFVIIVAAVLIGCGKKKNTYTPTGCLPASEERKIFGAVMRYASKLAPEATHENKFDPKFDWYYDRAVNEAHILFCSADIKDSTYHILVARKARSIMPMEEGIAISLKWDAATNTLTEYNEVFRTWKMPHDTLTKRGYFLFNTMMTGGDLNLYTSKFQQDRMIEFPDDRFKFDKTTRRWKDLVMDSVKTE